MLDYVDYAKGSGCFVELSFPFMTSPHSCLPVCQKYPGWHIRLDRVALCVSVFHQLPRGKSQIVLSMISTIGLPSFACCGGQTVVVVVDRFLWPSRGKMSVPQLIPSVINYVILIAHRYPHR